jgi:hypothetical protein
VTGNISFDLDGVLANYIRGFLRIGHTLFGTPVGGHGIQKTWYFEDFDALCLSKPMVKQMWAEVVKDPTFWAELDPLNPSIMRRINRLDNRIFITNREGIDPLWQSKAFLERWGVHNSTVFVAKDKVPIAQEQNVTAHLDDFYPNCVEMKKALPNAYVALLWTGYNEKFHAEWRNQYCGDVVLSVDEFMDELDTRGLAQYARHSSLAVDTGGWPPSKVRVLRARSCREADTGVART